MEAKLKSAYLNKERAAQIAEQEAMRFETMVSTLLCIRVTRQTSSVIKYRSKYLELHLHQCRKKKDTYSL